MTDVGGFFARAGLAAGFVLSDLRARAGLRRLLRGHRLHATATITTSTTSMSSPARTSGTSATASMTRTATAFRPRAGASAFDNSDCWVRDQAKVKLSTIERHNVNAIVEAEEENGCR